MKTLGFRTFEDVKGCPIMKCTREHFEKDLKFPLQQMGFSINNDIWFDELFCISVNFNNKFGIVDFVVKDDFNGRVFINGYQPNLFLQECIKLVDEYGYNKIPETLFDKELKGCPCIRMSQSDYNKHLRQPLLAMGFRECASIFNLNPEYNPIVLNAGGEFGNILAFYHEHHDRVLLDTTPEAFLRAVSDFIGRHIDIYTHVYISPENDVFPARISTDKLRNSNKTLFMIDCGSYEDVIITSDSSYACFGKIITKNEYDLFFKDLEEGSIVVVTDLEDLDIERRKIRRYHKNGAAYTDGGISCDCKWNYIYLLSDLENKPLSECVNYGILGINK